MRGVSSEAVVLKARDWRWFFGLVIGVYRSVLSLSLLRTGSSVEVPFDNRVDPVDDVVADDAVEAEELSVHHGIASSGSDEPVVVFV